MERAEETLEEARILASANHWNACVNRLYYSCLYAVTALLVRGDFSSSRHSGVRSLFNRHFVKPGILPADLARIYNDLFERRQEADYLGLVRFDENQVTPWIPREQAFIEQIVFLLATDNQ